jgi:hypothetical protein
LSVIKGEAELLKFGTIRKAEHKSTHQSWCIHQEAYPSSSSLSSPPPPFSLTPSHAIHPPSPFRLKNATSSAAIAATMTTTIDLHHQHPNCPPWKAFYPASNAIMVEAV